MAGRPKRETEVKGYLLRLTPDLIDRLDLCCSILDVATRQRLPRNTRLQMALEEWCTMVENEVGQPTPVSLPGNSSVAAVTATIPSDPPTSVPHVPEEQPFTPLSRKRAQKKAAMDEYIQRILDTREQYERLPLTDFAQLLFDRDIYRARDRKTGEEKPVNIGTLGRWLQKGGMS